MGLQIREALRCLCVEFGWSYAFFWRAIGSENPMHLEREDGHWEHKPGISGFAAMGLEDGVEALANKMKIPKIHIVGNGIVGKAASMGNHQWILRDAVNNYGSLSEGLEELNHQFSAGIQTIAIIPVPPYGVIQLGSTQMVMENHVFVIHVKNLFAQVGCVREPIFSDVSQKALTETNELYGEMPLISSEVLPVRQAIRSMSLLLNDLSQPSIHPVGMSLIQQLASSDESNTKCQDQSAVMTSGLLSSTLAVLEEQHLSTSCTQSQEFHDNYKRSLGKAEKLDLGPYECMHPISLESSNAVSLIGRSEISNSANDLGEFSSLPGGTRENINTTNNLPSSQLHHILEHGNQSNRNQGISVDSCPSHCLISNCQSGSIAEKHIEEHGSFQYCDAPSSGSDANGFYYSALFGTPQSCMLSSSNTVQEYSGHHSSIWDATYTALNRNVKCHDESELPHIVAESTSLFPIQSAAENDLYDVLGPDYNIDSFGGSLDQVFVQKGNANVQEQSTDISTCTRQLGVCSISDSIHDGISEAGRFPIGDADQLLDAVVSKSNCGAKQNSNDNVSCTSSMTKTTMSSVPSVSPNYGLLDYLGQMRGKSFGLLPVHGEFELTGSSSDKSACSLGNMTEQCSQSVVSKSEISEWIENGQSMECDTSSGAHSKRVCEIGKLNHKRARSGENSRPRPKDRQMIMDRVKELREIIPDGAKCSIDALLEKTIKHMLFLQSVTKHADNLKDIGEPKFVRKKAGSHLGDTSEGGVTWASEVGTQSLTCPLIVEDLNPPRQMLVEMLCERRGFFLEIADLIRGIGLTILKGVMESHRDKIWARFAVEAKRDVTRMEIFLSLVHLLDGTVGISASPHEADNIMA